MGRLRILGYFKVNMDEKISYEKSNITVCRSTISTQLITPVYIRQVNYKIYKVLHNRHILKIN